MKKILIANRAEIAMRVIRTAKELGITTVVPYEEADRDARFVQLADEAYSLGDATYTDAVALIEIAIRAGADAVHPGYGFLSEIPEFAEAVAAAGLTWIGPDASVLRALGNKISARQVAERASVDPVPGISDPVTSREIVEEFIALHGVPVVMKKSDGGGGRGITVIRKLSDLDQFFAINAGKDGFFVEKFVETARHVETQCLRDSTGTFALVSTRDCSIQRRNQKLIEEAPAPGLSDAVHAELERASRTLFEQVGYVGAGTCEFLVDGESVYFLEVNPRLQVEHTVSEEVSGLDLVAEQIRLADGGTVTIPPPPFAHSFEFRINAENPAAGMAPSAGTIESVCWPLGQGVRIESGIEAGDAVGPGYDPMMAKIIVTGVDRAQAIARSLRALSEFRLEGVANARELYMDILATSDFKQLAYSTRWFEETFLPAWADDVGVKTSGASATYGASSGIASASNANIPAKMLTFTIELDGRRLELKVPAQLVNRPTATSPTVPVRPQPLRHGAHRVTKKTEGEGDGTVTSPMQAIVVRVLAEPGTKVKEGDLLVVLESMKMESYVHAPIAGTVGEVAVSDGDNVTPGTLLLKIEE